MLGASQDKWYLFSVWALSTRTSLPIFVKALICRRGRRAEDGKARAARARDRGAADRERTAASIAQVTQMNPPAEYHMVLDGQQRVQSLLLALGGDDWGFLLEDREIGLRRSKNAGPEADRQNIGTGRKQASASTCTRSSRNTTSKIIACSPSIFAGF